MAEKILNGNFFSDLSSWYNWDFVWDTGRARATSYADSATEKIHTLDQTFSVSGAVSQALITAWRRYEAPTGTSVSGYVRSIVELHKPDLTYETLVDETKTGLTGEGNLLSSSNITSKFTQQGDYTLRLQTKVASARDESQAGVSNPYDTWTNDGFTLSSPNCYKISGQNITEYTATIYKTFTIANSIFDGKLTVNAKGIVTSGAFTGYARFVVRLLKPGTAGEVTLYDDYLSDGNWTAILNNLDITAHLSTDGTYRLTLLAYVKSSRDPDSPYDYYPSEAWYGTLSLVAKWYEYSVSNGYWDNISLDVTGGISLVVADSTHAHAVDNVALTQAHALVVAEATHAHTADNIVLSIADVTLFVADSVHAHSVDEVGVAQATKAGYAYYLSGATGIVYHYDSIYKADGASSIPSYWRSKTLDFSEQYPQFAGYRKTLSSVTLTYVDKGTCLVTVYVSTDGGQNWIYKNKTLGTGDGATKRSIFHFWKTAKYFDIKIAHSSTTADFQFIELEAEFSPRAEYFEMS